MKMILILSLSLVSASALANYKLSQNENAVNCYGGDNQSFTLNTKRTTVKYTVEGMSLGPKKITKVVSDKSTCISYTTSEGTLTLSDTGNSFLFTGDREEDKLDIKCN